MQLTWMRQHRGFIEAFVRFGNTWSQVLAQPGFIRCSGCISPNELQVLEYILENEEHHQNMAQIAQRLMVSPSNFSKTVKELVSKGLLEKYHSSNNRKNIIVRASDLGKEVYADYVKNALAGRWGMVLDTLDTLPPESVQVFSDMLNRYCDSVERQIAEREKETSLDAQLVRIG